MTTLRVPQTRPRPRRLPDRGLRLEIQALRAAAVSAVVLYHFWPARLPGGFVGVDVFFVISGFLISSHLLREADATGSIRLGRFWARRARRLLPAALVVLAATALGTLLLVPRGYWLQTSREILGSIFYVQNWVLASDSVNYLAAENVATPVQHFWSLSVEEQFYLVWPLLLLAVAVIGRRGSTGARRTAVTVVMSAIGVSSLAWCIHLTLTNPGPAYFETTTRAWEFAAGGLLAVLGTTRRAPEAIRAVVGWLGWLGIAASVTLISPATPFPGSAALLPVLSTVAIIWAGSPGVRWSSHRIGGWRPVEELARLSYSLYLWHWPLLTFATFTLGAELSWSVKLVYLAAAVLLSAWTYRFVENPVRSLRGLTDHRARRTLLAAGLAVAIVSVPVAVAAVQIDAASRASVEAAHAAAAKQRSCFGAGYLDPAQHCAGTAEPALIPDPSTAGDDLPDAYADGNHCIQDTYTAQLKSCTFGTGATRVAMIGDSHMTSWEPALERLASSHHWTVTTFLKSRCAQSDAPASRQEADIAASCLSWNRQLAARLAETRPFDLVLVAQSVTNAAYSSDSTAIAGFRSVWATMTARGSHVVVLRDVSRASATADECLDANPSDIRSCSLPRATAVVGPDLMVEAAKGQKNLATVDLTDYWCTDTSCPAAIGGVVVYRDTNHITATFSATLAPFLGRRLTSLGY